MSSDGEGRAAVLSDRERLDWLQLCRSDQIGPRTFAALMKSHGSAEAVLAALPALSRRAGRQIRIASRQECEREIELVARLGARLIGLTEPDYPPALRAIDAPPPVLAMRGDASCLQRSMVGIVGSRNASAAGLSLTERLARELAEAGFVIASGLARGIDARAHRASLHSGTVAVLAGGLDRPYPPEHAPLAESIAEHGAILSEMPLGYEPRGRDFPRRNRLISGLALGLVVVEAARRSGSLITARFANEQGREVFAVPGHPLDPRAEGTNDLIRQGATLCGSAADVIDALMPLRQTGVTQPVQLRENGGAASDLFWDEFESAAETREEDAQRNDTRSRRESNVPDLAKSGEEAEPATLKDRIIALLGPSPVPIDDLVRAVSAPLGHIQLALVELELAGHIERIGGNRVALNVNAPIYSTGETNAPPPEE